MKICAKAKMQNFLFTSQLIHVSSRLLRSEEQKMFKNILFRFYSDTYSIEFHIFLSLQSFYERFSVLHCAASIFLRRTALKPTLVLFRCII